MLDELRTFKGSSMAQVVTRWPVTAEARVRPSPSTCRISSRRNGTVTGLSPSFPLFPAIIIMPLFHIHRRSQWPCGVRRGSALDIGGRGFETRRWYECLIL
jgi:hypothetical protein